MTGSAAGAGTATGVDRASSGRTGDSATNGTSSAFPHHPGQAIRNVSRSPDAVNHGWIAPLAAIPLAIYVDHGQVLAILLAMSGPEQIPLADVKNRLSALVDRVEREHGRVVITK